MASFKYSKAFEDDENPLTLNEQGIEMNDFSPSNGTDLELPNNEIPQVEESTRQKARKRCRIKFCYLTWSIFTTIILLALIIVAVVAHGRIRNIKWCCVSPEELNKCKMMANYFDLRSLRPKIECQIEDSVDKCVSKIDTDKVDTMTLTPQLLFNYRQKLQPIMTEELFIDNITKKVTMGESYVVASYKSTTVKGTCKVSYCTDMKTNTSSPNIIKNSINHSLTQYGRCPLVIGVRPDLLSAFNDCHGAAFTTITSLQESIKTGKLNESEVHIVCKNGTFIPLSQYRDCTRIYEPSRAVVVSNKERMGSDVQVPFQILELLHIAYLYFGRYSHEAFSLFKSTDGKNVIFDDRTLKLIPLQPNCTAEAFLGKSFLEFNGIKSNETSGCFFNEFNLENS